MWGVKQQESLFGYANNCGIVSGPLLNLLQSIQKERWYVQNFRFLYKNNFDGSVLRLPSFIVVPSLNLVLDTDISELSDKLSQDPESAFLRTKF